MTMYRLEMKPNVETDAQKVIQKFKDGVADGVIHGEKNEKQTSHYYKQGYDFGIYLYGELKIEENSE